MHLVKNKIALWIMGLVLVGGCSSGDATASEGPESAPAAAGYAGLISTTQPYPGQYAQPSDRQGTLTELTYTTRDYADATGTERTNNAYVYLPYGYDDSGATRYNIVYLIHGHYGDASTFLTTGNGLLKNVLDHMIADEVIDPVIVVTPTYNYGEPTANYVDADKYCRALPQELQHDLMPLVESRYHTYAPAADSAGLAASRSHRAIGGFSMGGVTTWYALDETATFFGWYLPMSGDCWSLGAFAGMSRPRQTADYLEQRIRQQGLGAADFYIWAASGTSDSAYRETLDQIEGMAQGSFFNLGNMSFHQKQGARHEYVPMVEYIYNALPFFFPTATTSGISKIGARNRSNGRTYTVDGRAVGATTPAGIYITGGKKVMKK